MAARRTLLSGGLAARTAQELTVPVEALREGRRVLRKLEIFVVRGEDETLAAYENHCPHAGGPLNQFPDRFFSRDQRHLLCTRHGAKFDIQDGTCVHGPCVGMRLNSLPITVDAETGDVSTSEQALLDLCADGGGAFIEEEVGQEECSDGVGVLGGLDLETRLRAKHNRRKQTSRDPIKS